MMRRSAVVIGLVVCAVVIPGAQASNPHLGTWKLNPAKSKAAAGSVATSGTTRIEQTGTAVKLTVDVAFADGSKFHWEYTTAYDGKDVAIAGNSPYGDTVAATKVDANTLRYVNKKAGKVTATQTSTVASDGKTRTLVTKGTNAAGQAVDATALYEKQ
jgi:hypothetical protein